MLCTRALILPPNPPLSSGTLALFQTALGKDQKLLSHARGEMPGKEQTQRIVGESWTRVSEHSMFQPQLPLSSLFIQGRCSHCADQGSEFPSFA